MLAYKFKKKQIQPKNKKIMLVYWTYYWYKKQKIPCGFMVKNVMNRKSTITCLYVVFENDVAFVVKRIRGVSKNGGK